MLGHEKWGASNVASNVACPPLEKVRRQLPPCPHGSAVYVTLDDLQGH